MFVSFEKIIPLPMLVLGSPVQLVVAERKSKGDSGRGAGLFPGVAQPGSVPASSCLWEYSHFYAKTASAGCSTSAASLGQGPHSPEVGDLKYLATFGFVCFVFFFLEVQDWGEFRKLWEPK